MLKDYELINTELDSNVYGVCELCNDYVSEVFSLEIDENKKIFGHENCLKKYIKSQK